MPAPAVRKKNKKDVLLSIFEHDGISRASVAKITNLALSTLSYIIRELEEEGFLESEELLQGRGKPARVLKINPGSWFTAGIKVGREEVRGTLFDARMIPIRNHSIKILSEIRNNDGYTEAIKEVVEKLRCNQLLGIGVCSSGIVEDSRIVVSHLMNVRNLDIKELLMKKLGIKRFILMNDVDALCYSVSKAVKEDFLVVTYGTGIGASAWAKGQTRHFEIGHTIISSEGKCYCGQTGCLEYHASEYAVLKRFCGEKINFEDFARNEEEKYRSQIEQIRTIASRDFMSVKAFYNDPLRKLATVVGNLMMVLKPARVVFLGEGMVNRKMIDIIEDYVIQNFNKEFINDATFTLGKADWEHGVASAVVHKFIADIIK
ncbi:MAG: hypothetical protein PWQ72_488 [Pseudothermotoga sp.]|nr:hypothetical protein [Pseudothermotoga sp.]